MKSLRIRATLSPLRQTSHSTAENLRFRGTCVGSDMNILNYLRILFSSA